MVKKINFPLIMRDEKQVRNLKELQDFFDMNRFLEYYKNGKLKIWLEGRGYTEEFKRLERVNCLSSDYLRQLCGIFTVPYLTEYDLIYEQEKSERKQKRRSWIQEYTDRPDILEKAEFLIYCDQQRVIYFDYDNKTVELYRIADGKIFVLLKELYSTAFFPVDHQSFAFLVLSDHVINVVLLNLLTGTIKKCETSAGKEIFSPIFREYFQSKNGKVLLYYQESVDLEADYQEVELLVPSC